MTQWTQLGPREREILAILRRADDPPTTRELLEAVHDGGDDVAYTTVKRTVERLVEKGLVGRVAEPHRGSVRHRYRFAAAEARPRLVRECAAEIRAVLGEPAAEELAAAVRTNDYPDDTVDATGTDTVDGDGNRHR